MPLPLFTRLPRGLKLVMVGMVLWLVGTVPLAVYLLLARVLEHGTNGPGLAGVIAFALNVVAVVLVLGGVATWVHDDRRTPPSSGGPSSRG